MYLMFLSVYYMFLALNSHKSNDVKESVVVYQQQCFIRKHLNEGISFLKVHTDKIEGQSIDLQVYSLIDLTPLSFYHEFYSYKNITTGKEIFIALDNENTENYFTICFKAVPDFGYEVVPQQVNFEYIHQKNDTQILFDAIMNMTSYDDEQ